ncbi:MAG: archaeosortase/exosortase family protein [Planctomycetota bacterium]
MSDRTGYNSSSDHRGSSQESRSWGGGWHGWWRNKHPVFRFVALLAVLLVAWELLFWIPFVNEHIFKPHLRFYAWLTGMALRLLGKDATVHGEVVSTSETNISIVEGCDAIQPVGLFIAAVLASPVLTRRKYPGLIAGTLFLMMMNLFRIVFLYFVIVHYPKYYDVMHRDVSQTFFILLVVVTWVTWALWAVGAFPRRRPPEPAVATG